MVEINHFGDGQQQGKGFPILADMPVAEVPRSKKDKDLRTAAAANDELGRPWPDLSIAHGTRNDPLLARVVTAGPDLPDAIRRGDC